MEETKPQSQEGEKTKKNIGMAILAYILFFVLYIGGTSILGATAIVAYILFFVPLLTKAKNDPFVKYHVKQGLVLFICAWAGSFISWVLPFLGRILIPILALIIFVLVVIGVINAGKGEEKPLPIIGKFGEQLKF